jgi:hypothetical protein
MLAEFILWNRFLGFLKSLKNSGSDFIGHGENWVWLNVGAKKANSGFLVR